MTEPRAVFGDDGNATETGYATCFSFDEVTGVYGTEFEFWTLIGSGIPASSTRLVPPEVKTGEVLIFKDGSWSVVPDHRGESVYSTNDLSVSTVTQPGDYPAGTTPLVPATRYDKWDGKKWVTDAEAQHAGSVAEADKQKQALLYEADSLCRPWQTQLLLGIITDADKASLTTWMKYYQQVQVVDTSKIPASFPTKPM